MEFTTAKNYGNAEMSRRVCANPDCNTVYDALINTSRSGLYCPACRKKMRDAEKYDDEDNRLPPDAEDGQLPRRRRRYKKRGAYATRHERADNWQIVHDPVSYADGGFRPGAVFDCREFYETLRAGNFSDGLIIRHLDQTYTLSGGLLIDEHKNAYRYNHAGSSNFAIKPARAQEKPVKKRA